MKRELKLYYICTAAAVLLLCAYPVYMGTAVLRDMAANGAVSSENYPKYMIPYTPVSLAVLAGTAAAPLLMRLKKGAFAIASALSLAVFFAAELLLENLVIVTETASTTLESWQMYMCYVPPEGFATRTWRAVDVLIGEYSPAFKLHFYFISVVLVLGILNCVYGFARIVESGERKGMRVLTLQAAATGLFLGLCILACFTAFFRDGELTVSPLSAVLMCGFFIVLGLAGGLFTGSLLDGKSFAPAVSAAAAGAVTLVMYIGEMILLSGNLYRFGSGFFFEGLGALVLAPADLAVIAAAAGLTYAVMRAAVSDKSAAADTD